jgi:four helix bundle protein
MKQEESPIWIKSKAYAVRIIRLTRHLQDDLKEYILSNQIKRSGTSIGANVRESRNAQSRADFINKLQIALKESDETQYWLELLVETEYISQDLFDSLMADNKELTALLTSIINSTKNNQNKP